MFIKELLKNTFYFTAKDTGKFYIRICSGNDWVDSMYYFFYVGPAIQTFDIVDMPTYGGVNLLELRIKLIHVI